jgi:ABC-type transporter Mla subunit MlaD
VSAEAHYFRVGSFVLAGAVAAVAFALFVGGRGFFDDPLILETYFEESVQGLEVGSPMKIRGVQFGTVSAIGFVASYYRLPNAYERIQQGKRIIVVMKLSADDNGEFPATQEALEAFIEQGLRLRVAQAGLTGTAFIAGDFVDPEVNPPMEIDWTPENLYIPSATSIITQLADGAEKLIRELDEIDFQGIAAEVHELVSNLNEKVGELDLARLQSEASELLVESRKTLVSARSALDEGRKVLASVRGVADDAEVAKLSSELQAAIRQATDTLAQIQRVLDSGSQDIGSTLENLRIATENLEDATDIARQYPSVLFFGEPPPRETTGGN